jgi:hypothetical protein
MAYVIESSHFPKFKKKVAALNKRGRKIGGGISIENVEETFFRVEVARGRSVKVEAVRFELAGEIPVVNGYRLVARVEHTEKGNIITRIDSMKDIGDWRSAKPNCDHCSTNRRRKDTFFVEHVETGIIMQVGRTCLADFIRDIDVDKVASYFMFWASFEKEYNEGTYRDYDATAGYPETRDFVACACAAVRQDGCFYPSKDNKATVRSAEFLYWPLPKTENRYDIEQWQRSQPTKGDFEKADAAMAWIKAKQDGMRSEYIWNLQVACNLDHVTGRTRGLVASLVAAYDRDNVRAKKPVKKVSEHIGNIGERIKGIKAVITMVRGFYGQFGECFMVLFEDSDGNKFKWFTSTDVDYEIGAEVVVTGTVKKHDAYKGVKQTVLTRCKIKVVDNKAA